MDDLFVKRPGQRPSGTSSDGSDSRAGARRMVREMVDIVLDESPDKVALSPDEERLRGAGRGAAGKADDESWNEALAEASRIGLDDEGFVPDAADDEDRWSEPEARPEVDGLFARRREPGDNQGGGAAPVQNRAMADDLFFRKKKQEVPPVAIGGDGSDEHDEDDGEDDEGDDPGSQPKERKVPCACLCARCYRCLPGCCRSYMPGCGCLPGCGSLPSKVAVFKYGGATLLAAALLAVVTIALVTGCASDALFGRICIFEGDLFYVQWIIALTPVTFFSLVFLCCLRRAYKTKEVVKQASWQHDGEAQRSAAELLDTLAVAPPAERHKYAPQAVQVLKDFPDKAVIQYKGCAALEAICRAQKGNVQHVHAAGAVPTILKALDQHLRVRKVQSAGLSTLACLAKLSKVQIYDLGGIETILRSMTKFKRDPVVQVSGAMALGALCLSSVQNRRSVARFGGVSVLLQALERHIERADVIIASSETLALIGQDSTGLQKQLLAALPVIQGISERYESARQAAATGSGSAKQAEKKIKDCDVVLRSLRKLEARLGDLGDIDEEDAASDVATPRLDPKEEGTRVVQTNNHQSSELMGRLNQWKK